MDTLKRLIYQYLISIFDYKIAILNSQQIQHTLILKVICTEKLVLKICDTKKTQIRL